MPKSRYAEAIDAVQRELRDFFKERGFQRRSRSYNRPTVDGLTQVLTVQMGASDPPGTTYIPGLRENLHGLCTVNLGVYVPEVARFHGGGVVKSWVHEYHCCVRSAGARSVPRALTCGGRPRTTARSSESSACASIATVFRSSTDSRRVTKSSRSGGHVATTSGRADELIERSRAPLAAERQDAGRHRDSRCPGRCDLLIE